jgi:hypothetical protein
MLTRCTTLTPTLSLARERGKNGKLHSPGPVVRTMLSYRELATVPQLHQHVLHTLSARRHVCGHGRASRPRVCFLVSKE